MVTKLPNYYCMEDGQMNWLPLIDEANLLHSLLTQDSAQAINLVP